MSELNQKCKVVITAKFNEGGPSMPEYKEYSAKSTANAEAHGGFVLETYMIEQNLGDGTTPNVVLIVEYPSKETAVEAFSNQEYKSIIPLRNKAFRDANILVSKV